MNKSLAIIVAVGLALGCDDPAVRAAIDSVLDNGSVAAQAECEATGTTALGATLVSYQATRFADGTALAIASVGTVGTSRFFRRDSAGIDSLVVPMRIAFANLDRIEIGFESGDVVLFEPSASPPDTADTCAIDTCCTGFNLEAFE